MLETVALKVESPVPINATAARQDTGDPWVVFASPPGGEFFFPVYEGELLDVVPFTAPSARLYLNLAVLLGTTWPDLHERFEDEVAYLLNLADGNSAAFLERIAPWSQEVCRRYRCRMEALPAFPGEILWFTMAGVDVHAGRN
jgi:hypothetical protein